MNCPKCKRQLTGNNNAGIYFCPFCGKKLFEEGKEYIITITCIGQRGGDNAVMMVFVDDKELYEVKPGESICFPASAGFHNIKFRHKIRNKTIQVLLSSNFLIKTTFNSLTGLIETTVSEQDDNEAGIGADNVAADKVVPVMVAENSKAFDVLLGDDDPEFEIKATSGFKEGVLRLYSERCEFTADNELKKDVVSYKNICEVRKKMGSIDILCDGNVHKVYSIPKDIYNDVLAFLTNRVEASKASK